MPSYTEKRRRPLPMPSDPASELSLLKVQNQELAEGMNRMVDKFNIVVGVLESRLHTLEATAFGSAKHDLDLVADMQTLNS